MTGPLHVAKRALAQVTHRIHTLPVLVLMPHSRCNCRCVMCDIWKANAERREITVDELRPHLGALRKLNVRHVALSGGEALMHSNLWALCRELKTEETRISLLTTGLQLRDHADDVVRWIDETIVSLDGDPETHDAIRRVPRAYERLADGIEALFERDPAHRVIARSVVQRANHSKLRAILRTAREMGVEEVSFLAADVSSSAFNRPQPWSHAQFDDVALSPKDIAGLRREVEALIEEEADAFSSGYIAESAEKLRGFVDYFGAVLGHGSFPKVRCNAPWVSAVIEATGEVRPCFFHDVIGHVGDGPLDEILNSERAVAFRRSLDVPTNETCMRCVCSLHISTTA